MNVEIVGCVNLYISTEYSGLCGARPQGSRHSAANEGHVNHSPTILVLPYLAIPSLIVIHQHQLFNKYGVLRTLSYIGAKRYSDDILSVRSLTPYFK
jgi:hypothetical protein